MNTYHFLLVCWCVFLVIWKCVLTHRHKGAPLHQFFRSISAARLLQVC